MDIIIVDFGVNDGVMEKFNFDPDKVIRAHEELIRYVRNDMTATPSLLYAETFISPARVLEAPLQATNIADVHAIVTSKYDIPMVSLVSSLGIRVVC